MARNNLDARAHEVLVETDMETLEIVDCSGIPQFSLATTIAALKELRYLLLTHAGRAFGPKSVESLLQSKAKLCCLSISGAYLLKDEDAARQA